MASQHYVNYDFLNFWSARVLFPHHNFQYRGLSVPITLLVKKILPDIKKQKKYSPVNFCTILASIYKLKYHFVSNLTSQCIFSNVNFFFKGID